MSATVARKVANDETLSVALAVSVTALWNTIRLDTASAPVAVSDTDE